MKAPKYIHSLKDFLDCLNLAEEIEFFKIKCGTQMCSHIAGTVRFLSLREEEPRICVLEDGEETFYYSDGKFKPNGYCVLRLKETPKPNFIKSHLDNDGNPINLPSNLNDSAVLQFLKKYNFVHSTSYENSLNLDWISTKNSLWNMCRYYNLFSIDDYQRQSCKKSDSFFVGVTMVGYRYPEDTSYENRYIIEAELNIREDGLLDDFSNPYIFSVTKIKERASLRINQLPFKFINQKAAQVFIENFHSDLKKVVDGWRKLLS
jgi:hypothetical protein